jgi:hypothetical protein
VIGSASRGHPARTTFNTLSSKSIARCRSALRTPAMNRSAPAAAFEAANAAADVEGSLDGIESNSSGERGIRTHGTRKGTPDFESGSFGHSDSSPPRTLQALYRVVKLPSRRAMRGVSRLAPAAETGTAPWRDDRVAEGA